MSAPPLRPGDVVADRFEIRRHAGAGGMGIVYQGYDRTSRRPIALKVLKGRGALATKAFEHEVELLSTLDHPHVVGYVAHGVARDAGPFVVMPWLEGQDLQDRLLAGPLGVPATLTLARHVGSALAYLHGRGLVHADLKPSNLFLLGGEVERVQLIDLGVARARSAMLPLELAAISGTPGFTAPEQARGDGAVAPTGDIFSLGAVLFECLSGERLFGGEHPLAVLAKTLLEEPPRVRQFRADVPEVFDRIIHRMVSKVVSERPRDGGELCDWLSDLHRVSAGPRSLRPTSLTAKEQRVLVVLVVVLPEGASTASGPGASLLDGDRFHPARYGIHAQKLGARSAVLFGPDGLDANDQAAVLARFALTLAGAYTDAHVVVAAGSALTGPRPPVGEAIDRAMKLLKETGPRGVWLDDRTEAMVSTRFDVTREGSWRVLARERPSLDPTRPLLGRATSCVGREAELAALRSAYRAREAGKQGGLAVVIAPAGAGKSRLRHELTRRLAGEGPPPRVLLSRGDPLHLATPFSMIGQVLRQELGLRDRELGATGRARIRAHLVELLPKGDVPRVEVFLDEVLGMATADEENLTLRAARSSALAMEDQICHAFEDVLRAWCRRQPVLWVVEDAHWADTASIKMIDALLRRLDGERLFVLALARPEVLERFPELWEERGPLRIELPPLDRAACFSVVNDAMGDVDAEVAERIAQRSLGNAFVLEELIRAEAERGGGPRSERPHEIRVDLPETVLAVAQARLMRLHPEARKVLRAASVFGVVFPLGGVSALLGDEPTAELQRSLIQEEAVVAIDAGPASASSELSFRHALLRGAAYATLTEEDRSLGHRLAAMWLAGTPEDEEVVALHWLEAGEPNRAAECFASAGRTHQAHARSDAAARCALRALLLGEAEGEGADEIGARVKLLASALEATRQLDVPGVTLGIERHVAGVLEAVRGGRVRSVVYAAVERPIDALRAGRVPGAPRILARAACALGALADFEGARRLLAVARELAGADEVVQQSVRHAAAKIAFWTGEYGAAIEILSSAMLPDDWRERLEMLLILATAVVSQEGREVLARGLEYVSRAEALVASAEGDPAAAVRCAKARMLCFFFAKDYALAAEAAESAVTLSRRAGLRYEECINLHNAGDLYIRLGDLQKGRAALVDSTVIAKDIGNEPQRLLNDALVAYVDARTDRLEEIANAFRDAGDPWRELHVRYWFGHLLAARQAPGARRELTTAIALARELRVRSMGEDCMAALENLDAEE